MRIDINREATDVYLLNDGCKDYELPTEELNKGIINYFQPWAETGLLLPRLVWINSDHRALIYERPPFMADIQYHNSPAQHSNELTVINFTIPIPWTVWAFRFDTLGEVGVPNEVRLFARNKPISAPTDKLYWLPVPNMDPASRCCLGEGFMNSYRGPFLERIKLAKAAYGNDAKVSFTIAEMVNHILNLFWFGIFNHDYRWTDSYRLPSGLPLEISEIEDPALKGPKFLSWWSTQTLAESVTNNYSQTNSISESSGDTVADLIDYLDDNRKKVQLGLAQNNRLMHRIINDITTTKHEVKKS